METTTRKILQDLQDLLQKLLQHNPHSVELLGQAVRLSKQAIDDLHRNLKTTTFEDSQQEIRYFKQIYPALYAEYSFHVHLYRIESLRPVGDTRSINQHYERQLERTQHFFEQFMSLYRYLRSGATHFDETYFLRSRWDWEELAEEQAVFLQEVRCPVMSYQVGRVMSNDRVAEWLSRQLGSNTTAATDVTPPPPAPKLQWTGSKAALVELIYGLQGAGVFNESRADIKQLTSYFETLFSLDLGNVYNVFQEMRIRKKNRSAFLDLLRDRLIQRMDEMDDR